MHLTCTLVGPSALKIRSTDFPCFYRHSTEILHCRTRRCQRHPTSCQSDFQRVLLTANQWSFCLTKDCPDKERAIPSRRSHTFHPAYSRPQWGSRDLSMDLACVNDKMARRRPAIHGPVWPVSAPSMCITTTWHEWHRQLTQETTTD